MRIVGLLVIACLGAAGCKNKGDGDAPDPAALKAQEEMMARRDKLLDARLQFQAERDKLDLEIKAIEETGGDASVQIKKRAELDSQIETSTKDLIGMVEAKPAGGGGAASIAAREGALAAREKRLADREARAAERERMIAQRDFEAAQRWKDSCTTGAAPVIIQQAAPKGGNYTKGEVGTIIAKAKRAMAKKGLITADLPGPARNYENDATTAMNANDMSKAYFAAGQLLATVNAIDVNRAFIQAKTARLSTQVNAAKLDDAQNKELAGILGDVMQKYNNGDFAAANRRLNQLAGQLSQR